MARPELQTPADRDTLRTVFRQTTGTYGNRAGILAETAALPEGLVLTELETGGRYAVAASGASDHHLTDAGGNKLYVLPSRGAWSSYDFGATGDGVTNDTSALQAAIDAVGDNGTLIIPAGTYVVTSTLEIALSTNSAARLEILAYGATFEISGAIAGIARERPSSVNTTHTNCRIAVRGLNVEGDGTAGQHGFRFFTTYGLVIEDCHAKDCDVGFVSVFGMKADIRNCFATNNYTGGFHIAGGASTIDFGSGGETAITGATANNANSNGAVLDGCRVFGRSGADYHFKVDCCELDIRSPIAEGTGSTNLFEYDQIGSTVSKGIRITEPHVECEPTNAVYKFYTSTGTATGTYVIDGQDVVTGGSAHLFDCGSILPTYTVVMTNSKNISGIDDLVIGTYSAYHPTFMLDSVNYGDWTNTVKWGSGTIGQIGTTNPLRSGNDWYDYYGRPYHGYSLSFNYSTYADWIITPGRDARFDFTSASGYDFELLNFSAGRGLVLDGVFAYGEAETGFTTLGSVVGRMAVYDATRTLVGYAPLYDSIT